MERLDVAGSSPVFHSYIFHDLSSNPTNTLKGLIEASRSSHTIRTVLEACENGIRVEHASLGPRDSGRMPQFRTLHDLTRLCETKAATNVTINMLSTVIAQLGCFGLLVEREPSLLCTKRHGIYFVGLCAGILAAAAAAAATSHVDILLLSQLMTRVAFRVGIEADRRAQSLERSEEPWTLALLKVSSNDAEKMLKDFHKEFNIPHHRVAYISAELPTSITISGPPSTIKLFQSSRTRNRDFTQKLLSIAAPFHAEHLACPNISHIVDFTELSSFKLRSNVTLAPAQLDIKSCDSSLHAVLHIAIRDMFQSRLVIAASGGTGYATWQESTRITSIEPCGAAKSMKTWLGLEEKTEYNIAGPKPSGSIRRSNADEEIAIVGMAGRYPNADTLEEFWDIIVSGEDVHQEIPIDRFDAQASYNKNATGRNTTKSTSFGCFMKHPGAFDNTFFNLSPREAKQIDPQQRLILMVTQEALQMAGYSGTGNYRIGTFFGQATDDWRESHLRQDIDIFYVGGGMRAFGPGRLNYHYKWDGPSYSIDTACSASLAALELACKAVQSGDCDLAVAGGGNLCSALPMFSGLRKGHFTSSTGSCKTFCSGADGYCRGEAVGTVVIQRMKEAVRENRCIKGTVAGIVTNHSANASSITHPHAETQEALMLNALDLASLKPSDVDYVEFHGTGTRAGDKTEIASVSHVFDEQGKRSFPLPIGAVKANIGHCEAAAGIVSLIKALLMIHHNTIPPHCGIKHHLSPDVKDLMSEDLMIPSQAVKFKSKDGPKNVLINNFNATGGNTCMILREPPRENRPRSSDPRTHFPVTVSAQSPKSLRDNLTNLKQYLRGVSSVKLSDISYSCTARREHYKYRKTFTAKTLADLTESVEEGLKDLKASAVKCAPRVAFVFAGQGTQAQGIAKELFETSPLFKSKLQEYESLCISLGYPSFLSFLVDEGSHGEFDTVQLQLATVAVELSLARLWQSWGIEPSLVVGHSIGEYAALCLAGVIFEADLFSLVGKRAQLMKELCQEGTHTMLSVQSSPEAIVRIQSEEKFDGCEIACYNSPHAVTLSGPKDQLERMKTYLSERNIKSTFLKVTHAFHSPNIEPILDNYSEYATSIPFHEPLIPIMSTLLGEEVTKKGVIDAQYLADQARSPVMFNDALSCCGNLEGMDDPQKTIWIEFGPGKPACLSFIKSSMPPQHRTEVLSSLSTYGQTWQNVSHCLAKCFDHGVSVDWTSYHRDFESALTLQDMPKYAFDLQEFWIPLESETKTSASLKQTEKLNPLLHSLEKYSADKEKTIAVFQSSLSDPYLFDMISGHSVMNTSLCPSSVYCAMAIKAASFLENKSNPEGSLRSTWELVDMNIHQPLIAKQMESLKIQISATKYPNSSSVSVSFSTHMDGDSAKDHGVCLLRNSDTTHWKSDWSKVEFLVDSRIKHIESAQSENIIRLQKPVIYKLFSHVVAYSNPFQGIKRITLDEVTNEAVAEVQFEAHPNADADYDVHVIDSLMHFAGFVLNNGIQDDENVFISDGWETLRVLPGIKRAVEHKYYARLTAVETENLYSGDIYAFLEGCTVAYCGGVRFRKMKKHTLSNILQKQVRQDSKATGTLYQDTQKGQTEKAATGGKDEVANPNSYDDCPSPIEEHLKRILAAEAGVAVDEILDTTAISELGFDSILMMSVLDKIEQQLDATIPSQEATAVRSFGDFKDILHSHRKPGPDLDTKPHQHTRSVLSGTISSLSLTEQQSPKGYQNELELSSTVVSIIAKHTDVPSEQVELVDDFGALGVDSILSLDIIDAISREAGIELPASFLQENPNVKEVRHSLDMRIATSSDEDSARTSRVSTPIYDGGTATPPSELESIPKPPLESVEELTLPESSKEQIGWEEKRECKVRLVQGNAWSKSPPLFFLPPGDGTVNVYAKLPKHPDGLTIFSPESPFAAEPDNRDNTFANVSEAYKDAIRKTFPDGPYYVAGYSVGGAYAFEVARLLLEENCEVPSLVIIDCPAPGPPLKDGIWFGYDAMAMVGFAGYLKSHQPTLTTALLEYTAANTREFNRYIPKPIGKKRPENVTIIWSTHGRQDTFIQRCVEEQILLDAAPVECRAELIKERQKGADLSWCFAERTDFGPQGWDQWLGNDVRYEVVEGDHFSIAIQPTLTKTAEKIYHAMQTAVSI